jgi:hypothetical protein
VTLMTPQHTRVLPSRFLSVVGISSVNMLGFRVLTLLDLLRIFGSVISCLLKFSAVISSKLSSAPPAFLC